MAASTSLWWLMVWDTAPYLYQSLMAALSPWLISWKVCYNRIACIPVVLQFCRIFASLKPMLLIDTFVDCIQCKRLTIGIHIRNGLPKIPVP